MGPSPALQRIVNAKRLSSDIDLAPELRNRRIRPPFSRLEMYNRLIDEYRTDEFLGWDVHLERSVKILPRSETPNMFKNTVGCCLVSITQWSSTKVVMKFSSLKSGRCQPHSSFLFNVLPGSGSGAGGVTACLDDELMGRLHISLSLPFGGSRPCNVLMLSPIPVIDSVLALGRFASMPGCFPMLGLKLEGMDAMGFIYFFPMEIEPEDAASAGDLCLEALDLAGFSGPNWRAVRKRSIGNGLAGLG